MPKISILMNCFNGETYLKEALDSIYAQTFTDWEIIFIDNASTDKSAEIAKSYDARIKYHQTQETIPLYAARNHGLQYACGQFITFLDVDDSWKPEKLSQQLRIMEKYPQVNLICTGYFRKNEQSGTHTRHAAYRSKFLTFSEALNNYPVSLSSVMLRYNNELKNIVRFEPTLNLTGDYELFIKLIYKYKAYFIAKPLVTLRVHSTNLSAKLVHDWPKELEQTHARLVQELSPSRYEKMLMDKRYVKTCGLVYLADKKYRDARQITKKYVFKDAKLSLIYLSTFNHGLAHWLVKLRGF